MSRKAIVTGASRGIGRAIAERLISDGWTVCNLDREPPKANTDLGDEWIEVDLADTANLAQAIDKALSDGPVTGLVNNAAIGRMDLLENTSLEDFDESMAVNVRANVQLAQALIPGMRQARFGRIVNISSRAHLGKTHRTAYAASKAAVISLAKVWALEYARDGITCNAVAPGPIRTELFDLANPPDMPRTQAIIDSIPVGRIGEPSDIANAVAFFMDERSSYVTGQVIYACGGITLSRGGS